MPAATSRIAFLSLLLAGVFALSIEVLVLSLNDPSVALWMLPTHVGMGGPLVLLGAALGALAAGSWASVLKHYSPTAVSLVTGVLSAPVVVGAWVILSTLVTMRVVERTVTLWMGSLVAALMSAFALLMIIVLAGPLALLVHRGLEALSTRPIGRLAMRADLWLPALIAGAALITVLIPMIGPNSLKLLPWGFATTGCAGLAALLASWRLLLARPHLRKSLMRALPITVLALSLFTLFMPLSMERARRSFYARPAVVNHIYMRVSGPLDFDKDGALSFYGDGDCAPFDPAIGPHQMEIPNDGIDQNCSGSDFTFDVPTFDPGPSRVDPPEGIARRPNIILVTTDALSHPHTTVGGYERDTTPNLAEWASRATVFDSAFANGSATRFAMPGILASKMNSQMRMTDRRVYPFPYAADEVTLGTILRDAGYRTVHIPGDDYFENWREYAHGFDEFDVETYKNADDPRHTSPVITDRAIEIINEHDDQRPLALWVHYFDHHGPYELPEGAPIFGKGKSNMERFESELWFADQSWKRIFETVEARWEPEDYVMVFTSDHGESFDGNHIHGHHGLNIHTSPIHVPLIIQAPFGRGQRIDGITGHIDILPTLANLLDLPPREDWLGETLVPTLVDGTPPQKDAIYSLFYYPEEIKRGGERFKMIGTRTNEFYYFDDRVHGIRRLVRWREDPLDAFDLTDEMPEEAEVFRYITGQRLQWLREREEGLTAYAPIAAPKDDPDASGE